jgi:hypothetical protein
MGSMLHSAGSSTKALFRIGEAGRKVQEEVPTAVHRDWSMEGAVLEIVDAGQNMLPEGR